MSWANKVTRGYKGLCLQFVRHAYGVNAIVPTAAKSWDQSKYKHKTDDTAGIPVGAPIHFTIPGVPAGHIALYAGNGRMRTNISAKGTVETVGVEWFEDYSKGRLIGWTNDVNGVKVISTPRYVAPAKATNQPTDYAELAEDGVFKAKTVSALQILMRAIGKYTRAVDGKFQKYTKIAVQEWLADLGFYKGKIDGDFKTLSVKALQEFLKSKGLYSGRVDGKWGEMTTTALQEYLNTQNGK